MTVISIVIYTALALLGAVAALYVYVLWLANKTVVKFATELKPGHWYRYEYLLQLGTWQRLTDLVIEAGIRQNSLDKRLTEGNLKMYRFESGEILKDEPSIMSPEVESICEDFYFKMKKYNLFEYQLISKNGRRKKKLKLGLARLFPATKPRTVRA